MRTGRPQLVEGEYFVATTHTHGRALFWPAVALLLVAAACGAGFGLVPPQHRPVGQWLVAGAGALLLLVLVILPFLGWLSASYTFTNRRIIARDGWLSRRVLDLPLDQIRQVSCQLALLDRLAGAGTLTITLTSGQIVQLHGMPEARLAEFTINELLVVHRPVLAHNDW